jgi:hypothetical protein
MASCRGIRCHLREPSLPFQVPARPAAVSAAWHSNLRSACLPALESRPPFLEIRPLLSVFSCTGSGSSTRHNAVKRRRQLVKLRHCQLGAPPLRNRSAFFGTSLTTAPNPILFGRALALKTCLAAWQGPGSGAFGNGYDYDSRIPPPPNYIAFPLPTPPVDAQFLPNTALPLHGPVSAQQQGYYQQQPPPYYPPPQLQQPVGVFWDIENSSIPKGARVGAVVRRIRAVAQQFG